MNDLNDISAIADELSFIIEKGFILTDVSTHFLYSTYGVSTADDLQTLMDETDESDVEMITDLIITPDNAIQERLEPIIEDAGLSEYDEKLIQTRLISGASQTVVWFPDGDKPVSVPLSAHSVNRFIRQLKLTKSLAGAVADVLNRITDKSVGTQIKVMLRNSDLNMTENIREFLVSFFSSCDNTSVSAQTSFILPVLEEAKSSSEIMQFLINKRNGFLKTLDQIRQVEALIKKNTMETLMLQGVRIPSIGPEDLLKKITMTETILNCVYGWYDTLSFKPLDINHGNVSGKEDINRIFRLMS